MVSEITFETPENVEVTYRLAGPGTRFLAWLVDTLIVIAALALAWLVLGLVLLASMWGTAGAWDLTRHVNAVVVATLIVVTGLGYFGYFAVAEWATAGQTIGKRLVDARVVKEGGFSLTATTVLARNLMRVLDTMPILWVVPVVSRRFQRFGDMVAGTVVVFEPRESVLSVREHLAGRDPAAAQFSFTGSQLAALNELDVRAMETFLERRDAMSPPQRLDYAGRLARTVAARIGEEASAHPAEQERYIEDLVAAYARREMRELI